MIAKTNLDFWWHVAWPRDKQEYGYGGNWSATDVTASTDCSGVVCFVLAALTLGPAGWRWTRWPFSTESWRALNYWQTGPFGTICVPSPADIPADAQ